MHRKLLLATLACLRVEHFVMVIVFAIAAIIRPVMAADDDLDAVMQARCPAYAAWLKAHPSHRAPLAPIPPDPPPSDPWLRAHLLKMAHTDQEARAQIHPGAGLSDRAVRDVYLVDAHNLAELKVLTTLSGFPTAETVGRDGVDALWLLVQHADADPDFQARALVELQPLVDRGDLGRDAMAKLTDRVRLARGESQLYATQFLIDHGVLVLRLTEDLDHLEERRRSAGLPPLADYECAMRVTFGVSGPLMAPQ